MPIELTEADREFGKRWREHCTARPIWTTGRSHCYWPDIPFDGKRTGLPDEVMSLIEPSGETNYFITEQAAIDALDTALRDLRNAVAIPGESVTAEEMREAAARRVRLMAANVMIASNRDASMKLLAVAEALDEAQLAIMALPVSRPLPESKGQVR